MTAINPLRLAIDIGGTFTDTVLVEGEDVVLASSKTLTTHENPADGAIEGAKRVMAVARKPLAAVTGFIHGTTLATNALIERRGATVATITTEGFRDVIEMRTENRFEQYDLNLTLPPPLISREHRFVVSERIGAQDGAPLIAPFVNGGGGRPARQALLPLL